MQVYFGRLKSDAGRSQRQETPQERQSPFAKAKVLCERRRDPFGTPAPVPDRRPVLRIEDDSLLYDQWKRQEEDRKRDAPQKDDGPRERGVVIMTF